jgi:hypothetical protein
VTYLVRRRASRVGVRVRARARVRGRAALGGGEGERSGGEGRRGKRGGQAQGGRSGLQVVVPSKQALAGWRFAALAFSGDGGDDYFDSPFEIAPHRTASHLQHAKRHRANPAGCPPLHPALKTQAMIRRRPDVALLRIPPFQILDFRLESLVLRPQTSSTPPPQMRQIPLRIFVETLQTSASAQQLNVHLLSRPT